MAGNADENFPRQEEFGQKFRKLAKLNKLQLNLSEE
jgi:hypothetical protein